MKRIEKLRELHEASGRHLVALRESIEQVTAEGKALPREVVSELLGHSEETHRNGAVLLEIAEECQSRQSALVTQIEDLMKETRDLARVVKELKARTDEGDEWKQG